MTISEQVNDLISKCDEMKKCKFIFAPTKIKDILKSIVNGPELYQLFELTTQDFNYPEMRQKCLINGYGTAKTRIVLPQDIGDRLAFIFCLLVDFDSNETAFTEFLQQYFPECESFAASYRAFCSVIIDDFSRSILQIFSEDLKDEEQEKAESEGNAAKAELLTVLNLTISRELQYIADSKLVPEDEKEGGKRILYRLSEAIKAENKDLIDALICGYNYFVLYYKCVSEEVGSLIKTIAEYEEVL